MKNLGILITTAAMIALLGFVGNDELHPGGDFKDYLARICIAGAVALIGILLIQLGGKRHEHRRR